MGCNCGKKKNAPAGSKAAAAKRDSAAKKAAVSTSLNASSAKTQKFSLNRPDGSTAHYGSKLEARAEQVRRGGTLSF